MKEKGITLIALVVTIVVLLILAGVSISMLTGENGIITQASKATIENCHATVKDAISLAYNEYQTELKISEKQNNFFDFLIEKNYIKEDGTIIVKELTGDTLKLGNGTDGKDVYKIEDSYIVKYYGNAETETKIIWKVDESQSNIELSTKYYIIMEPLEYDSKLPGDVDNDDVLTALDAELYLSKIQDSNYQADLLTKFGREINWNNFADLNSDGKIDENDASYILNNKDFILNRQNDFYCLKINFKTNQIERIFFDETYQLWCNNENLYIYGDEFHSGNLDGGKHYVLELKKENEVLSKLEFTTVEPS